jgi:RNA polymerase II-associated protein 2
VLSQPDTELWHNMVSDKAPPTDEDRIRTTALRQAKDIEERKQLRARVADLVVEAFDLPSKSDADPAHPQPADAALFRQCLSLFQPSDLDDLIYERNVDDRCGYALCPKPNLKIAHGGEKVWNQKGGKDFKLVDKVDLEKWCSRPCQERTAFVRSQLASEPAWLRIVQTVDIKLLDEVNSDSLADSFRVSCRSRSENHADNIQTLAIAKSADDDVAERMQALALERGDLNVKANEGAVDIIERDSDKMPRAPRPGANRSHGAVEGHQSRKVRFSEQ